ncbi:hypothetical protein V6M85_05875 [Sulfolobus tengchongensis]|uniref:Uncharacterized protein n=1 Tax=Sulfolobus tengchongensis TaxID=207809 RepID=A0AAX4L323_9CREN
MTSSNNVTFDDILQYELIKRTYHNILMKLDSKNMRTLKQGLKELLNFVRRIKDYILDKNLKRILQYQQKLAKRLLFLINIRFLIFFIYKMIINNLIVKLYESIKTIIQEINEIIRY